MDIANPQQVVINGRFLTQELTGVQRFALELTRTLAQIRPITVAVPDVELHTCDVGDASIHRVRGGNGHLWEQVTLPRFLRANGRPLLVNLASTGPRTYRPKISTHHDITYVRHPDSFTRAFRAVYRVLIPKMLKTSAAVVTVSEFSKSEIASHFGIDRSRIHVVPNAVANVFDPDIEPYKADGPYLLAVSSPNKHKNFDRLATAFERASLTHISKLVVVGSQSGVFTRSAESEVENVVYAGRVDDPTLARMYKGATAFAFPSLYEGFGIPPLEAQLMRTPVIAAHSASIPEVLEDSALYFDPLDVADITRAIERIDGEADLRQELIAAGQANAERFSWQSSGAMLAAVIDTVLTRH